ncbi:MAG: lipid II flippase MurJ [Alsobacter sp.]
MAGLRQLAGRLMAGALLGKVVGFAREVAFAQVIGASMLADGFRGALTAMLLPLAFLQNESVPAVLVPLYKRWQQEGRAAPALAAMTLALGLVAIVIMAAVIAAGEWWVEAIVGGFDEKGLALTRDLLRVMALAMPASVVINVLAAAELALGRARLTSVRASLQNLAVLAGIAVFAATGYAPAIAWAFAIAFNVLALYGLWTLGRDGLLDPSGLRAGAMGRELRLFFRQLRPLMLQPFSEQAHHWVERALASRLAIGTVASLDYARTLTESAVLLISQPLGLSVLAQDATHDHAAQVDRIARPILALTVPASVFAVLYADDVVHLVFGRGAFGASAIAMTGSAMSGIAAGLWATVLGWILLRLLNRSGRNGHAAAVLTLAFAANIACNLGTSPWQATHDGTFLIGLGETARGLVLLFGCALVLGCAGVVLRLVAQALPAAILMAAAGLALRSLALPWTAELALGLASWVVATGVAARILVGPFVKRASQDLSLRIAARLGAKPS